MKHLLGLLFFAAAVSGFSAPELKWKKGGCFDSWCETGWYSSPYVGPLETDDGIAIVASAYSIVRLNPADGSLIWRAKSGHAVSEGNAVDNNGRTWPGIIVADVDGDGAREIATAHGGGVISLYDAAGEFKKGFPCRPTGSNEIRSLAVADLDNNGQMELVASRALLDDVNTWVVSWKGSTKSGWPRTKSDDADGYAAGVYNANAALGDMDGDGKLEVVIPSDVHYICAYFENGTSVPSSFDSKPWGAVGAYTNASDEERGWGDCSSGAGTTRANFAGGTAAIVDVDGDGKNEVVAVGNVHDCSTSPYTDKYIGPFIFNADRSRWQNWYTVPVDTGAILLYDYDQIESVQWNVVVADIDGDGKKEVLFPSFDGKLHCFWLDKTEHDSWPFTVGTVSDVRMASEPLVVDLDNDGKAEIIFTSWPLKGTGLSGDLFILSSSGVQLHRVQLPIDEKNKDWDGVLAAGTLGNIDDDADLELVLQSAHSGVLAYDLPNTSSARVLWGTGRGNFQRTGNATLPAFTPHKASSAGGVAAAVIIVLLFAAAAGACGFFVLQRHRHGQPPLPSKEEWSAYGAKAKKVVFFWRK